jgi:hypothetical protein
VGRTYAGILGPLAFFAVLARGLKGGWPMESSLLSAWLALVSMALVGYVLGRFAQWIVDDSVRIRMREELAAREAARTANAGSP